MADRREVQRLDGENILRFDVHQRIQHILMFSSFIVLAMTGLPLKFHEWPISQWWISVWGGVDSTRSIHRAAGVIMALDGLYHISYIFISIVALKRPFPLQMVPSLKDIRDFVLDLKYTFGFSAERARFDRFSYREKFDYFAVFWGMALMVGGGLVLMFPVAVTQVLPGWLVPVALVAHSDEAILAVGWILIVHMFFAHLAPGIFPFNKSIFTGKMPAEKYAQEHPMEYERIIGARPVSDSGMPAVSGGAGEPQNTGGQGGSDKLNAIENSTWDTSGEGNASGERRMGLFKEALCLLKGDRLVQIGLVILILTAALVSFVSFSAFPLERPLFGLMLYLLLPLLWVVGAIVFILAILRH